METSFKCCRKKEFSNLVYIVCINVYHPSCIDRKSYFKSLGTHRIICSKKCEQEHTENRALENQVAELRNQIKTRDSSIEELESQRVLNETKLNETIGKLQDELKAKEAFIKREKRQSQSFKSDVIEAEEKMLEKVREQRDSILDLNRELKASGGKEAT